MFTVLPQGFKNSSYFLQQVLLKALKDIDNVVFLADDVIIFSTIGIADNIDNVIRVIERLNNEGLKIDPKKFSLPKTL